MSESLKPTCIRFILAVLNEDDIMMFELHTKIADFFDIIQLTPEDDELKNILTTLDKKDNIHLPIYRWGYKNEGFGTHPDRNMGESEVAEKYGNKLAILIWERFGMPRISE